MTYLSTRLIHSRLPLLIAGFSRGISVELSHATVGDGPNAINLYALLGNLCCVCLCRQNLDTSHGQYLLNGVHLIFNPWPGHPSAAGLLWMHNIICLIFCETEVPFWLIQRSPGFILIIGTWWRSLHSFLPLCAHFVRPLAGIKQRSTQLVLYSSSPQTQVLVSSLILCVCFVFFVRRVIT
jgi:hypothetical protein